MIKLKQCIVCGPGCVQCACGRAFEYRDHEDRITQELPHLGEILRCRNGCGGYMVFLGTQHDEPPPDVLNYWVWRSVSMPQKVITAMRNQRLRDRYEKALYYTVRSRIDRAKRAGKDGWMSNRREQWNRFATRDDALRWIDEQCCSRSKPKEFVIVRHVAKRKAGSK